MSKKHKQWVSWMSASFHIRSACTTDFPSIDNEYLRFVCHLSMQLEVHAYICISNLKFPSAPPCCCAHLPAIALTLQEAGALVSQANQASQSASDTFVSIAFTIVIGLLTIVTLGVSGLVLLAGHNEADGKAVKASSHQ
eukprot:1158702-Pelagomonas_calceolata.AAC.27